MKKNMIAAAGLILLAAAVRPSVSRGQIGFGPDQVQAGKPGRAIEWVAIAGGTFELGTPDFADAKPIPGKIYTIRTFEMSKTLVTVEQYAECVINGQCEEPRSGGDDPYCNWGVKGRERHPINCVSWEQAKQYTAFMGVRLPSEAEWEYAARSGGRDQKYPWGNEDATCARAVMYGNGGFGCAMGSTMPVCSKPAGNTAQDLCDMAGNVREWLQDKYQDSYVGAPADGRAYEGPGSFRVLRGGSFVDFEPKDLRADRRDCDAIGIGFDRYGFRVARASR